MKSIEGNISMEIFGTSNETGDIREPETEEDLKEYIVRERQELTHIQGILFKVRRWKS